MALLWQSQYLLWETTWCEAKEHQVWAKLLSNEPWLLGRYYLTCSRMCYTYGNLLNIHMTIFLGISFETSHMLVSCKVALSLAWLFEDYSMCHYLAWKEISFEHKTCYAINKICQPSQSIKCKHFLMLLAKRSLIILLFFYMSLVLEHALSDSLVLVLLVFLSSWSISAC